MPRPYPTGKPRGPVTAVVKSITPVKPTTEDDPKVKKSEPKKKEATN